MGKSARERSLTDTEARSVLHSIRVSPQKLNLVATMIRGKDVGSALHDLTFTHRRIADTVKKALESAVANAENNHQLDVDPGARSRRQNSKAVFKSHHCGA